MRGTQFERLPKTHRIAFPALGAQAAAFHIILAVVRRGDQIDQVGVAVRLEAVILGQQHPPAVLPLLFHLVGPVELLLQHGSDLGEERSILHTGVTVHYFRVTIIVLLFLQNKSLPIF